ncbi:3-oxoacyl-ACP synthase [Olivibacter sp. SDN3]|uniref:3-oxoacyl-ACP synthase n=1 Tax=Olivibacter sp. SDN3 TaxID=2764720 RepID=UPI0016519829|nr:3-oxoacyl-ACP synthase [Olivibacter sp. SDN3]QNL48872.1 3-oxoacyl-ACP synthase [Olivibacter sp. SDN3]
MLKQIDQGVKEKLYEYIVAYVDQRITTAQDALTAARDAANDDTKSSAGDKYETTREMMQQEIERSQGLLKDAEEMRTIVDHLNSHARAGNVCLGSLVLTDHGHFYLSISAGTIILDEINFYVISSKSPLGKLFLYKSIGDDVLFNGKRYQILGIL